MGEAATDMIDGTACSGCGAYFAGKATIKPTTNGGKCIALYSHGFPVLCWSCWPQWTPAQRRDYQRASVRII